DDDVSALLRLLGVNVVDVQRMMVHGQQAEQVVICLSDRLGRPVLVDGTDLELLQVAPVGMGSGRLALGLVSLHLLGIAHLTLRSPWSLPGLPRLPRGSPPLRPPNRIRNAAIAVGKRRRRLTCLAQT